MPVIKLFANLRKLAGTKEASISRATLGEVLNELVKRFPSLDGVIFESNGLRPHVIVTLNGHNTNDLSMQVTEEDIIAIFPPIAGG